MPYANAAAVATTNSVVSVKPRRPNTKRRAGPDWRVDWRWGVGGATFMDLLLRQAWSIGDDERAVQEEDAPPAGTKEGRR